MNRRAFFQRTLGALAAAVIGIRATPFVRAVYPVENFQWPIGTVGGINRATYSFWRNQTDADREATSLKASWVPTSEWYRP